MPHHIEEEAQIAGVVTEDQVARESEKERQASLTLDKKPETVNSSVEDNVDRLTRAIPQKGGLDQHSVSVHQSG